MLMQRVNDAMSAFYAATVELGVANKVTTFTASDFGRTLSSNADGSDHGWGSHQFVMGGAVNGGRFYGTAPHVSIQTDDQVGQGRLLPSTSRGSIRRDAGALVRLLGRGAAGHPAQRRQLPEHQPRLRLMGHSSFPSKRGRAQRSGHFHGGASSNPCPSIAVSPSSLVSVIALQCFASFSAAIMRDGVRHHPDLRALRRLLDEPCERRATDPDAGWSPVR